MSKFTDIECKKIQKLSLNFEQVHSYATLEIKGKFIKNVHEFFHRKIKRNPDTQWIFDRFKEHLNYRFPDNIANLSPEVSYNVYPKGCNLDKHIDAEKQPDVVYICGVLLNGDFTGGEFVLYNPEEVLDYPVGTIYDLDVSSRIHEIKKVTSGERISLVLFLSKEQLGIKETLI